MKRSPTDKEKHHQRCRGQQQQQNVLQRFLSWDWCLLTCCLIGVGIGFAVGFVLYLYRVSGELLMWFGLPGELYMRMLKAAVLPLLISSIITGTAGLKPKENGRAGVVSLTYIIVTNVIGAVIGVCLALIIKPGEAESKITEGTDTLDTGNLQTSDLFADLIRNLVPDNVVVACFQKSQTYYKKVPPPPLVNGDGPGSSSISSNISDALNSTISAAINSAVNDSASTTQPPAEGAYTRYQGRAGGANILGLVVVCTVVGMASAQKGEAARPFVLFFQASADVLILLLQWLVMFTPVGAASLIAHAIGKSRDIEVTFRGLGLFVLAESLGNVLLILVMLPLIHLMVLRRRNPFAWMPGATRGCVTAMVTSSSVVAMPQHMETLENRYGVDKRITSFIVPLATAINRDGSTMFIALTAVYMAQLQSAASVDTILLITILSAVGSLAIPATASASIVTNLMIMDSLGVPPANIGILLALEWFSDRFRTLANNYSHVLCCLVTWHLCKSTLLASDPEDDSGSETVFSPKPIEDGPPPHTSSIGDTDEASSSANPLLHPNGSSVVEMSAGGKAEKIQLQSYQNHRVEVPVK